MFTSARIKLTGWYLLIIMLISISFSVAIYNILTSELNRVEEAQRFRIERQLPFNSRIPIIRERIIDPELIIEAKERMRTTLIVINFAILGLSGLAGYFLAGRTLRPIQEMVDEQKRFIADASHELRTPLTSLKSEIEVNLRDKSLHLKEAKDLLNSNLEEVNKLQSLSDNLIKYNQNQKHTDHLYFQEISIEEIINESKKKISGQIKYKHMKLNENIKDITFDGDEKSLIELFVIILDNAIKYSHDHKRIYISTVKRGNYLSVDIKDEGIGIAKEDIPHLFYRFYRVDRSRSKTDVAGFGLGLAIAKQIVEKHDGFIKVNSELGVGTTFSVYLPLKQINNSKTYNNFKQIFSFLRYISR